MVSDEAAARMREIRRIAGFTAAELQALGDTAWEAECVALATALDLEADLRLRQWFHAPGALRLGITVPERSAAAPAPGDPRVRIPPGPGSRAAGPDPGSSGR